MTAEQYSYVEKLEIIHSLGVELRAREISEMQFREGIARLGFNATDIDYYTLEAKKNDL